MEKYYLVPIQYAQNNMFLFLFLFLREQVAIGCFQCKAAFCAVHFTKYCNHSLLKLCKKNTIEVLKLSSTKLILIRFFDAPDFEGLQIFYSFAPI